MNPYSNKNHVEEVKLIFPEDNRSFLFCGKKQNLFSGIDPAGINLAKAIIPKIETINAAGITFMKIFKNKKGLHLNLIKAFLLNLDMWGSQSSSDTRDTYLPIPNLSTMRFNALVIYTKIIE